MSRTALFRDAHRQGTQSETDFMDKESLKGSAKQAKGKVKEVASKATWQSAQCHWRPKGCGAWEMSGKRRGAPVS
jgi:hypothetical protein